MDGIVRLLKNDKIIWKNSNSKMYLKYYTMSELFSIKNKFVNWKKNRPPDNIRIAQIEEYYSSNYITLIPGIIYVWKFKDKFIIYDGIHRLMAGFKYAENIIANKIGVLIHFIETEKEQDIINEFLNINKSICVPSIYLEETDTLKKIVCETIAEKLCNAYPKFVSPSRKPFIYNFNRDNLIDFISTLNVDFSQQNIDNKIYNELIGLNLYAHDFVKRQQINYPKKCDFYKFYLWYLDKSYIKSQIEKICN
jgi:hypothetical protein